MQYSHVKTHVNTLNIHKLSNNNNSAQIMNLAFSGLYYNQSQHTYFKFKGHTATAATLLLVLSSTIMIVSVSGVPVLKVYTADSMISKSNETENSTIEYQLHPFVKNGLFEGDLKISEHFIKRFYNLSSFLGRDTGKPIMNKEEGTHKDQAAYHHNDIQYKRAAIRDTVDLWTDGTIPYQFSHTIPTGTKRLILEAIIHWETHTCLNFLPRSGEHDYIEFENTGEGCYSDSIGRKGGKQIINLEPNNPSRHIGCEIFGKIVHEIGHAVGFWHEQSRPDRDNYVTIDLSNVKQGEENQFLKRSYTEVDSRGFKYDYGSIMHYGESAFVRDDCIGCQTITVTNPQQYRSQNQPRLGQENGLSTTDIMQTNRLYLCSNSFYGILSGNLRIYAQYGHTLPDSDGIWSDSDPYLEIVATDHYGTSERRTTSEIDGNLSPVWNEWVVFENRQWVQFSVTVYDSDFNADDPLSNTHSWTIASHGYYANRVLQCYSGYVIFDYSF